MTRRPRLLDLFCGEGGAGRGFQLAGFDVTGVDLAKRCASRYPGRFIRGDAVKFAVDHAGDFDAVHASPPCKVHTSLAVLHPEDTAGMLFPMATHVDLIPDTRAALVASGRPWIIENVPGAPLIDPVTLCGSMFGLGAVCEDGWRQLWRHRLFESTARLIAPGPCQHDGSPVGVYGNGGGGLDAATRGYKATQQEANEALQTPWMSRTGVSQAIPPAYTEWLGAQLLDQLGNEKTPEPMGVGSGVVQ